MAELLLLTPTAPEPGRALPSLGLLSHRIAARDLTFEKIPDLSQFDAVLVDGTDRLAQARETCFALKDAVDPVPVLLIVTEGGLPAVTREWGASDVVLDSAGPAEVEARLRLLEPASATQVSHVEGALRAAELMLDPVSYSARLHGEPLDLTFKEFELLRFLMTYPGQVFTRAQLLSEVWGYDYYGGTRTVDVHVRRLRAKLGMDHEALIGTVRNVGYRFDAPPEPLYSPGT